MSGGVLQVVDVGLKIVNQIENTRENAMEAGSR